MAKLKLFHRINCCDDEKLLFEIFKARKHELETSGDLICNVTTIFKRALCLGFMKSFL
jgi:hypothetical protein